MKKKHLIKGEIIKTQLDNGYLPTKDFIEYLLNNVEDFKKIKLNKNINDACLLDLNIIKARISNSYMFEYEIA